MGQLAMGLTLLDAVLGGSTMALNPLTVIIARSALGVNGTLSCKALSFCQAIQSCLLTLSIVLFFQKLTNGLSVPSNVQLISETVGNASYSP
jgi:hypothetical protein